MPRKSTQERLEELTKKKDRITAQIQKVKAAGRSAERRKDTRRKIIAGALALEHASIDPAFGEQLKRLLQEHVTRPEDRKLFNL